MLLGLGLYPNVSQTVGELRMFLPGDRGLEDTVSVAFKGPVGFFQGKLDCDTIRIPYNSPISSVQFSGFWYIHRRPITTSVLKHFHRPKKNLVSFISHAPIAPRKLSSNSRQPLIYFLSLEICLFWTFHTSGITQPVVLRLASCAWHHVFEVYACCGTCQCSIPFDACYAEPHFICPSNVGWTSGWSPLRGSCEDASLKGHAHVCVQVCLYFSQVHTYQWHFWTVW